MRYILKLIALVLCVIAVSSCDSEKNRMETAQALIEKKLFETLPDYESYQAISTELDSVNDCYLFHPEIVEMLNPIENDRAFLEELYGTLGSQQARFNQIRNKLANEIKSGSYDWVWNVYSIRDEVNQLKASMAQTEKDISNINARINDVKKHVRSKLNEIDTTIFVGYHITHKFRAKDEAGVSNIRTMHYITNSAIDSLYCQWPEGDYKASLINNLIQECYSFKDNESN